MGAGNTTTSTRDGQRDEDAADYQLLFRLLTENARELVSRHTPELTFLYASPAALAVLGHPPEKLVGNRLEDLTHPDDLASLVSTFALAAEAGETSNTTFRCRTGQGEWRWCEIFCRGVENERHGSIEIHATTRDITHYKKIEKAIERVAREWRSTFDAAHDAILMLDANTNILRVNLATLKLFNCEFRDLIGHPIAPAFHHELGLGRDDLDIDNALSQRAPNRVEVRLPDQDRWLRCSIDPIILADSRFDGTVIFLSDITSEKRSQEKLVRTLKEVRKLSRHLDDIRETERRSIAREVHDELGHMLTALKMDASWLLKKRSNSSSDVEQRGKDLLARIDQTIETTRRIVTNLRPPVLDDLGLDAALDWLISDFRKYNDLEINIDLAEMPERMRGKHSITVFRIVQEALTNIQKHAHASRLDLEWKKLDEFHVLNIHDNGRGFDTKTARGTGCYGLLGIGERVRSLDGSFRLESSPGKGTMLTIQIPDAGLQ